MSVEKTISENSDGDFVSSEATFLMPAYMSVPMMINNRRVIMRLFTYGAFKRGFDLVVSSVMLVILSPVFLVIAVLIKLDSPGPVFFRQERTGKNGGGFNILKFRSMVANNDLRDASCEDKYTRLGEKLRKSSIDELPQLINVVRGQMAFIGPRPWVPEYWENMNERERERCRVRPGITGLAAASGRNGLSVFEKIGLDLQYVDNYSLKMDIRVIFMTIRQVFSREEAEAGKGKVRNDIKDLKRENRGRV